MMYLLSLSLVLLVLTYLYYAYQGDSTAFLLSGMVIMALFLNGPEQAFIYGIDRTYMTLFGILIYTLVGAFLWPVKADKETINDAPKGRVFVWLDPEYFKATVQLFCVYWASVAFWIYFNPPTGFMVVMLASLLGLFTAFSPLKPTLLVMLFTLGFFFAIIAYVLVLPNLVYAWELALFIFIYTFIAFYVINPKVSVFFLIGMFTLGIENEMSYNFDVFLMILLTFYMFLIILILFYHFPFSSQPEYLYSLMKERFFKHSNALLAFSEDKKKLSFFERLQKLYHGEQLKVATAKMQLWGSKIDTKYFNKNTPEILLAFSESCLAYLHNESSLENCYNAMQKIDWDNLKENRF